MAVTVNVDNFVRAETHRMFADLQRDAGGVGVFRHNRQPASIDDQTVIRMNRDTLLRNPRSRGTGLALAP